MKAKPTTTRESSLSDTTTLRRVNVMSSAILDSATATSLLDSAKFTLVATRANESAGQRPGQMPELLLCGEKAADLVCWPFVLNHQKAPCACGGKLAHICQFACGGAVNAALGKGKHACKKPAVCKFPHPPPEQIRAELEQWWRRTRPDLPPVWTSAGAVNADNNAMHGGERSNATSAGDEEGDELRGKCTVPMEVQIERLRKHEAESAYLRRFLREDFFEGMLRDAALRPLLAMRKCAKEVRGWQSSCVSPCACAEEVRAATDNLPVYLPLAGERELRRMHSSHRTAERGGRSGCWRLLIHLHRHLLHHLHLHLHLLHHHTIGRARLRGAGRLLWPRPLRCPPLLPAT